MNTLTIPAFSAEAAEAAQRRLDNLAKVPRSLGRIEELAVQLAGITGKNARLFPKNPWCCSRRITISPFRA